MSQTKIQKLTLRNKPEANGRVTVGANVELLLDGKPLKGATYCKIELKPSKIAKITVEYIAEVDVELFAELTEGKPVKTPHRKNSKPTALYTLSNCHPETITKPEN